MVKPKDRPTTTKAGIKNRFEVHKDRVQKHFDFLGKPNPFAATHAAISRAGGPKYTGFRDTIDGGGPGMSGAMFSSKDLRDTGYDIDGDNYISQAELNAAQQRNPALFAQNMNTGIGGLSNNLIGARPLGSYGAEADLTRQGKVGTNIGLDSGIMGFLGQGGILGGILRAMGKDRVNPNQEINQTLDPNQMQAVQTPVMAGGGLVGLGHYATRGLLA